MISCKIPIPKNVLLSPIHSAITPLMGKIIIIIMEYIILLTEIMVARCSDGILEFRESEDIGVNSPYINPIMQNAGIAIRKSMIPYSKMVIPINTDARYLIFPFVIFIRLFAHAAPDALYNP